MDLRYINLKEFTDALNKHPEKSIRKKAKACGVSESLIRRILKNQYPFPPKEETRLALCEGLNRKMDVLFPLVTAKKNKAS